ncbi:MAG: IMP dehydrogenase [Moraxella sp.]
MNYFKVAVTFTVARDRWCHVRTNGSSDRYFQDAKEGVEKLVPEGIKGRVPYKGPMNGIINQLAGGLRFNGLHSCANIGRNAENHNLCVTSAGMKESHVHDVQITKEAPNYRVN